MFKLFEVSVFGCVGLGTVDVVRKFLLQCVFARASWSLLWCIGAKAVVHEKLGATAAEAGTNTAQHEPPSKPKDVGNSAKNASFRRAALSPQNSPWLGPSFGLGCPPKRPNLGPSCAMLDQAAACWTQVGPKLGPRWRLVGGSWPQVEPMFRTCRVETVTLCQHATCANYHIENPFWQRVDRTVGSYEPLSCQTTTPRHLRCGRISEIVAIELRSQTHDILRCK